ncbi:small membrane A-kinase anchor protein isoform 2-T4 [Megaptera novaeangliae]
MKNSENHHEILALDSICQLVFMMILLEGDPFQGVRVGSCLRLGNELSEETHVLTKQKTLLGRGAQTESSEQRGKEVITDMMFSERLSKLHQTHRSCQKTVTRNLFKLYRNVSRVTYLSRIRRSGRARGK